MLSALLHYRTKNSALNINISYAILQYSTRHLNTSITQNKSYSDSEWVHMVCLKWPVFYTTIMY